MSSPELFFLSSFSRDSPVVDQRGAAAADRAVEFFFSFCRRQGGLPIPSDLISRRAASWATFSWSKRPMAGSQRGSSRRPLFFVVALFFSARRSTKRKAAAAVVDARLPVALSSLFSLSHSLSLSLSLLNEQAKEFSKTTYRKTTYRLREVADKFEAWSRRQK